MFKNMTQLRNFISISNLNDVKITHSLSLSHSLSLAHTHIPSHSSFFTLPLYFSSTMVNDTLAHTHTRTILPLFQPLSLPPIFLLQWIMSVRRTLSGYLNSVINICKLVISSLECITLLLRPFR
jgi:hypothetical protein